MSQLLREDFYSDGNAGPQMHPLRPLEARLSVPPSRVAMPEPLPFRYKPAVLYPTFCRYFFGFSVDRFYHHHRVELIVGALVQASWRWEFFMYYQDEARNSKREAWSIGSLKGVNRDNPCSKAAEVERSPICRNDNSVKQRQDNAGITALV